MNKAVETLRAVVIGPEFVWIGLVVAVGLSRPAWMLFFGRAFLELDAVVVAILGAPFALVAVAYKIVSGIRRPTSEPLAMRDWPDYWRLKIRLMVGLAYSLASACSVLLGWGLYRGNQKLTGTALTVGGFGVAAIVVASVAYARHAVEDIIDGFEQNTEAKRG